MNIFISYGTSDLNLVRHVASAIAPHATVRYWDDSQVPGQPAWDQIFSWIDSSDLVIVLITGRTMTRAMSVGQEVGRAKALNKTIVPIVSSDVPATELGCLSGITYQPIDPANLAPSLEKLTQTVLHYKEKKKDDLLRAIFVIGLIVGAIFLSE